jgi:hypothetical protein
MDDLITSLGLLSEKPERGSDEYKNWITQGDFVEFLRLLAISDQVILYASIRPYTFIFGVLAPARLVTPPEVDDLEHWSCNPYTSWAITTGGGAPEGWFVAATRIFWLNDSRARGATRFREGV